MDKTNTVVSQPVEPEDKLSDIHDFTDTLLSHNDDIVTPESYDIAAHKYNIEPDISIEQESLFNIDRAFYGRHVVNSNTMRKDNFRHMMQMDSCDNFDRMPTYRHIATNIRKRVTGEFQMCRSNPEIGGFDRKLQRTGIRREDIDVRQKQTTEDNRKKHSSVVARIFGGGKK